LLFLVGLFWSAVSFLSFFFLNKSLHISFLDCLFFFHGDDDDWLVRWMDMTTYIEN
jgi:hypothetical protein